MKTFHFFDLDHTVLAVNSSVRFAWHLYRRGHLSLAILLKLISYYWFYTLGRISCSELYERAAALFFVGKPIELLKQEAEMFLNHQWNGIVDFVGFDLFNRARKEGDHVLILSSSPQFLVEAFSRRLGADVAYGTQYEIDARGIVRVVTTIMDGERKAVEVQKLAQGNLSYGYSDSHHDIPFLEAVDTAVAVNPNRKLASVAWQRGWRVERK